jgi:hypothetical protein
MRRFSPLRQELLRTSPFGHSSRVFEAPSHFMAPLALRER